MTNLTIVGAQWGDEGKGKIVDYFSNKFDVVLRFQDIMLAIQLLLTIQNLF